MIFIYNSKTFLKYSAFVNELSQKAHLQKPFIFVKITAPGSKWAIKKAEKKIIFLKISTKFKITID